VAVGLLAPAVSAQAAAPPNDAFAAAEQLSTPASVPGTTVDATREPDEPDYELVGRAYGEGSVWYSWTAPRSSRYRVADCGTPESRPVFVFTGSSLGELRQVPDGSGSVHEDPLDCGQNDTNGTFVLFDATAGTTYRIVVVDEFVGYNGPFQLTLDERPVPIFDSGIQQTASRASVKRGKTVTYTITLTNGGDLPIEEEWIHLIASKPRRLGKTAGKVRYVSLTTTRGTCNRQRYFRRHKGALCAVGRLEPGQAAVVTAKLRLRQSITHWVSLDYSPGRGQPMPDDRTANDESQVVTRVKR